MYAPLYLASVLDEYVTSRWRYLNDKTYTPLPLYPYVKWVSLWFDFHALSTLEVSANIWHTWQDFHAPPFLSICPMSISVIKIPCPSSLSARAHKSLYTYISTLLVI